nr:hypothetical protein [Burkholderiaceae bacterium]
MNLLQRLLALALLLASLGACAHPQGPVADDPAARAAVLDYYAQLRRAVAQRDALALKGLYEESFTHTHGSGKVDGRDAVARVREHWDQR